MATPYTPYNTSVTAIYGVVRRTIYQVLYGPVVPSTRLSVHTRADSRLVAQSTPHACEALEVPHRGLSTPAQTGVTSG